MDLDDVKYLFAVHKDIEDHKLMTPGLSEALLGPIRSFIATVGPSAGVLMMLLRNGAPNPIRLFLEKESFRKSLSLTEMLESMTYLYEEYNSGIEPVVVVVSTQAKEVSGKYSEREVNKCIGEFPSIYILKWLKKLFRDLF